MIMPQRRDKAQGLQGWLLVTNVCVTLITRVDAGHFDTQDVIIRHVDGIQAASYGASNVKQYVFFEDDMGDVGYKHARATCKAIGGDLAKVETVEKRDWIDSLYSGTISIFDSDLWLGLTESVSGSPKWAPDCEPGNTTLITGDSWATNKRCFRHQNESGSFEFDRKSCTSTYDFLCETYNVVSAAACDVHPTYTDSEIPDDDCDHTTTTTTTTVPSTTVTPTTTTTSTATTTTATTPTATTTATTPTTSTTATTPTTSTTSTTAATPSTTTTSTTTPTTQTTSTTATTPTTSTTSTTATTPSTTTTSTTTPTTQTTSTTATTLTTSTTSTTATTPATSTTLTTTTTQTTTTTPISTPTPTTNKSPWTTFSTWSTTPVDHCGDCFCVFTTNITTQEAQAIADQISKNLTVDAKSTSAFRRKLESTEDHRPSAKAVGFVGIIVIIIPFGVLILSDVRTIIDSAVDIRNVYRL